MHDPVHPPRLQPVARFTDYDAEFRRLVTKGALLELVTAGFYRFWLATRIRRYLWGGTFLDGDPLEYLGTGRELLYGFLFALAILAPMYLGYLLLSFAAMAAATLFLGAGGSVRRVWSTAESRLVQASDSGSLSSGKMRSAAAITRSSSAKQTTATDEGTPQDKATY